MDTDFQQQGAESAEKNGSYLELSKAESD